MKRLLLFIFLCYCFTIGKAEIVNASDSLSQVYQTLPHDTRGEQLIEEARMWVKAGQSEKALLLYQQALDIKDSIATALSNAQMEEIKNNYNLDKIGLEQHKQYSRIQLLCLIIILVILFLLLFIMYRAAQVRQALKYSESEIRKATVIVRSANELKNRFLSNMSYNIRTLLNNVVGFSQIIASEPNMEDKVRQEYSHIIHKSSDYLMKLVNDILDLSRLEARMMKFQIQTYDAVALCNEACCMARMANEKTEISIKFTPLVESQEITTDTRRLTQTLKSVLTYPHENIGKRIILLTLKKEEGLLCFRISNSPLADPTFASQETSIRNKINALLLKHFGGTYQVEEQAEEGPEIIITYPISDHPSD